MLLKCGKKQQKQIFTEHEKNIMREIAKSNEHEKKIESNLIWFCVRTNTKRNKNKRWRTVIGIEMGGKTKQMDRSFVWNAL